MKHFLFGASALALASCAMPGSAPLPPEAQLATVCNSIAAGYRMAAVYRAQGKLSQGAIDALTDLEPRVLFTCDPKQPPADLAGAISAMTAALDTIALANAGVK